MRAPSTKDASIRELVLALARWRGADEVEVVDHWDADRFAIGVARADEPARLVYVSTYQQPPGRYAFECEVPGAEPASAACERGDGVSFDELVAVIERHLASGHVSPTD